jgi:hypothetical protein
MKTWQFQSTKAIWSNPNLSSEAKVIWHILMGYRNHKTGEANPTLWTLRKCSGWGRAKVDAAIRELVLFGAINKRIQCIFDGPVLKGRECVYFIQPITQVVGNEPKCRPTDCRATERSAALHNNSNPVITVTQSINNKPSYRRLASAHPVFSNPQSPKPALEQNEVESLLEDRGLDPDLASITFDRMEANNWLDSNKRPLQDRATLENYVVGLAATIGEARSGTRF